MFSIDTEKKTKIFNYISSIAVAWVILLLSIPREFKDNNLIYAIGEIQAYDNALFNGNLYLGGGVVSPRFIVDEIFAVLMSINGGSWGGAALIWIYFGAFIYAVAIANIAAKIDGCRQIIAAIIFAALISYCDNYLGGFPLVQAVLPSICTGTGMAFAFLSISFVIGEERNYKAAWIFATLSMACHIHEGIYCCAIIFLLALADSLAQKKVLLKENTAVIFPLLMLLVIMAPNFFTDRMDISNRAFVYIYSIFRTPHHLVPSVWGIEAILKTLWIDAGLFLLAGAALISVRSDELKRSVYEATFLIGAWLVVIATMYFFTEVRPLAFVSTMTGSKLFKYVVLVALIRAMQAAFILRDKGNLASSYAVLFFAFAASLYDLKQVAILLIVALLIICTENYFMKKEEHIVTLRLLPIADILAFLFILSVKTPSIPWPAEKKIVLLFIAAVILGVALKRKFKGYAVLCYLLVACMMFLPLRNKVVFYERGVVSFTSGEKALRFSMGDELFDLAERFRASTGVSDEYLADPNPLNTGWFQVVSERNCFVVFKAVPSCKATMGDWYNRYMQVKDFDKKGGHEIKQIMNFANIEYVLVKRAKYAELDKLKEYSIFLSSANDSFRVYRLAKSQGAVRCK